MSRTITALFDTRSEAEAARDQLAGRVDAGQVRILDQESAGSSSGESHGGGFWHSVKEAFMPMEDRHAYQEGVSRGGFLLCAQVDESQADEAIRILDQSGCVDFDRRQEQWRGEGWKGYDNQSQSESQSQSRVGGSAQSTTVAEERIPLVEEALKVGKREVERGGARVRSFVEERPVHEQVNLREEHVSVERRPVDRPLEGSELKGEDFLQEREIEMTERSEEAVVAKEARVREEVVLRKTAEERTENIDDTVRRTDVKIEDSSAGGRPAFGFEGGESGATDRQEAGERSEFERDDFGRR